MSSCLTKQGRRGCGNKRKKGKLYLCCGTSSNGMPVSYFVCDPGIPYPFDYHRSPKLLKDENGINHVYMWIGAEFYKSPWFHIQETGKLGLSRLVSDNFPIEELIYGKSRIRLIYPYGIPLFDWQNQGMEYEDCHLPKPCFGEHKLPDKVTKEQEKYYQFCTFGHHDLSIWLADAEQYSVENSTPGNEFTIHFPDKNNQEFEYTGIIPDVFISESEVWNKKNWQPAILLDLPLTHIESPLEANEKIQQKVTNAGYDCFVTPW